MGQIWLLEEQVFSLYSSSIPHPIPSPPPTEKRGKMKMVSVYIHLNMVMAADDYSMWVSIHTSYGCAITGLRLHCYISLQQCRSSFKCRFGHNLWKIAHPMLSSDQSNLDLNNFSHYFVINKASIFIQNDVVVSSKYHLKANDSRLNVYTFDLNHFRFLR